jgi:hypothetical protein
MMRADVARDKSCGCHGPRVAEPDQSEPRADSTACNDLSDVRAIAASARMKEGCVFGIATRR